MNDRRHTASDFSQVCRRDRDINNTRRPRLQALQTQHAQTRMDQHALRGVLNSVKHGTYDGPLPYIEPVANTALCAFGVLKGKRGKSAKGFQGFFDRSCYDILPSLDRTFTSRKTQIERLERKIELQNIDLGILQQQIDLEQHDVNRAGRSFVENKCYNRGYYLQK